MADQWWKNDNAKPSDDVATSRVVAGIGAVVIAIGIVVNLISGETWTLLISGIGAGLLWFGVITWDKTRKDLASGVTTLQGVIEEKKDDVRGYEQGEDHVYSVWIGGVKFNVSDQIYDRITPGMNVAITYYTASKKVTEIRPAVQSSANRAERRGGKREPLERRVPRKTRAVSDLGSGQKMSMQWAATLGRAETVRTLIDSGEDPNQVDEDGLTPLMLALMVPGGLGYLETVIALLEGGADPNKRVDDGHAPLMFAVGNGDPDLVRVILEAGANPDETGYRGVGNRTLIDWVKKQGHAEVAEILENWQSGAD